MGFDCGSMMGSLGYGGGLLGGFFMLLYTLLLIGLVVIVYLWIAQLLKQRKKR